MKKVLLSIVFVFFGISFLLGGNAVFGQGDAGELVPDSSSSEGTQADAGTSESSCNPDEDIMLNTDIPFVGRCIKKTTDVSGEKSTGGNVFAKLMAALTRIIMSVVVIVGFMAILVGGFMIAMGGADSSMVSKGKSLIIKALSGLALVGVMGLILHLSNPNFFKAATL